MVLFALDRHPGGTVRSFFRGTLLVLLAVPAAPLDAHAQGFVRALLTGYSPAGDGLVLEQAAPAALSLQASTVVTYQTLDATGPAFEYGDRLGRWFGWSVQLAYTTLEIERQETVRIVDVETGTTVSKSRSISSDETIFVPLSGQFDSHLLPPGRYDLYAQLILGFSWYDEIYGGWVDDHFYYGWGVGLDIAISQRWAIASVVRFLQVEAEPREGGPTLRGTGEIDVDPWQFAVGLAYRFAPRTE